LHFEKLLEIIYWAEKYETTSPHHDFFFSIYIKFLKKYTHFSYVNLLILLVYGTSTLSPIRDEMYFCLCNEKTFLCVYKKKALIPSKPLHPLAQAFSNRSATANYITYPTLTLTLCNDLLSHLLEELQSICQMQEIQGVCIETLPRTAMTWWKTFDYQKLIFPLCPVTN
jgi:hypothetical protein